jgi:type IV secretory pathway TraG/TraD family ATPase VirD4
MRENGDDRHSRHPVMTPDMIRQLPAGRALVIRGGYTPAIARLPMAWKDPSYRHARRTQTAIATLTPATEHQPARLEPLPPGFAPGNPDPAVPAGIINGHDTRYPWDDDADPA